MKAIIICVLCLLIVGLSVAAIKLSVFYLPYVVDPPYVKHIYLDKFGDIVNDEFNVKKKCSYQINFDMMHKDKSYNEYKDILINNQLPVSIELQINLHEKGFLKNVFQDKGNLIVTGRGVEQTRLEFGYVSYVYLVEGQYQIQARLLEGDPYPLHGIDFILRINQKPKTKCLK